MKVKTCLNAKRLNPLQNPLGNVYSFCDKHTNNYTSIYRSLKFVFLGNKYKHLYTIGMYDRDFYKRHKIGPGICGATGNYFQLKTHNNVLSRLISENELYIAVSAILSFIFLLLSIVSILLALSLKISLFILLSFWLITSIMFLYFKCCHYIQNIKKLKYAKQKGVQTELRLDSGLGITSLEKYNTYSLEAIYSAGYDNRHFYSMYKNI